MAFLPTKIGSASSRATFALFPPNSKVTLFTLSAAAWLTAIPAPVEPVKDTISISECAARYSPISEPWPVTRLNTPAGRPISSNISARINALNGASFEGFNIIVQPAAIAGATFPII